MAGLPETSTKSKISLAQIRMALNLDVLLFTLQLQVTTPCNSVAAETLITAKKKIKNGMQMKGLLPACRQAGARMML